MGNGASFDKTWDRVTPHDKHRPSHNTEQTAFRHQNARAPQTKPPRSSADVNKPSDSRSIKSATDPRSSSNSRVQSSRNVRPPQPRPSRLSEVDKKVETESIKDGGSTKPSNESRASGVAHSNRPTPAPKPMAQVTPIRESRKEIQFASNPNTRNPGDTPSRSQQPSVKSDTKTTPQSRVSFYGGKPRPTVQPSPVVEVTEETEPDSQSAPVHQPTPMGVVMKPTIYRPVETPALPLLPEEVDAIQEQILFYLRPITVPPLDVSSHRKQAELQRTPMLYSNAETADILSFGSSNVDAELAEQEFVSLLQPPIPARPQRRKAIAARVETKPVQSKDIYLQDWYEEFPTDSSSHVSRPRRWSLSDEWF